MCINKLAKPVRLAVQPLANWFIHELSGAFFVTLIYDFSISRTPAPHHTG